MSFSCDRDNLNSSISVSVPHFLLMILLIFLIFSPFLLVVSKSGAPVRQWQQGKGVITMTISDVPVSVVRVPSSVEDSGSDVDLSSLSSWKSEDKQISSNRGKTSPLCCVQILQLPCCQWSPLFLTTTPLSSSNTSSPLSLLPSLPPFLLPSLPLSFLPSLPPYAPPSLPHSIAVTAVKLSKMLRDGTKPETVGLALFGMQVHSVDERVTIIFFYVL